MSSGSEFSEDFLAVNFLKLRFKIMLHNCATLSLDLLLCIVIGRINLRGQRDDNGDKNHNFFLSFDGIFCGFGYSPHFLS